MKKIFFQSMLMLAPMTMLAQKNEKEAPSTGSSKTLAPRMLFENSNPSAITNKLLPGNFPAANGSFLLNKNNPGAIHQKGIPKQSFNTNNSMPCLVPDMTAVAPMPVVSGLVNNSLPEPMPGAFIYNKKK